MRKGIFLTMLVSALPGCGILDHDRHCGFEVHWILPPTVSAQSLVVTGAPPVGLAGVGTVPTSAGGRPSPSLTLPAPEGCCVPSSPAALRANAPDPCNLQDVCQRLDALERRPSPTLSMPRAMPKGDPQQ